MFRVQKWNTEPTAFLEVGIMSNGVTLMFKSKVPKWEWVFLKCLSVSVLEILLLPPFWYFV